MAHTLLIANRGEIACRIMATARRLGMDTVAVYSDADAYAAHVRLADRAVRIGPAAAAESYLRIASLVEAARETGADLVHPGYGFLSENAAFAEAVIAAGIAWVGPLPETIRAMGLKDEAKRLAEEAGVPVLPGYRGEDQSLQTLQSAAEEIGYPLLIKAVAGGGGRGIRAVTAPSALGAQLESAVREAESAFGDGRVMLEKLVETPRHIEVQVFGDGHGRIIHLHERDCSLQRRRQKVIEEAPAPGMPQDVRAAMTDAAVRLAEAVGYRGAGTVEFIVDGSRPLARDSFWFLEMNTRLQVEHPVTEAITGLDLVELQLRVALGDPLPLAQQDVPLCGHAIEARICAEDPADNFRPGAGRIESFDLAHESEPPALRLDTGFESGDSVPAHYDSLIAKLIVTGETREEACERLAETLALTQLAGVPSNIGFLHRCVVSDTFLDAAHHVNWIAEAGEALTARPEENADAALAAVADILLGSGAVGGGAADPWALRDGFRLNAAPRRTVELDIDGRQVIADPDAIDPALLPFAFVTDLSPGRFAVTAGGDTFIVSRPDFETEAEALEAGDVVRAPMPGKVIAVTAAPGQAVSRGDILVVMEAMKMEHALTAPRDGTIDAVAAEAGTQIAEGEILIRLAEADSGPGKC